MNDQDLSAQSSLDVQVVRASSKAAPISLHAPFSQHACRYFDVRDEGNDRGSAKADCTAEMMASFGRPALNAYIEPLAWVTFKPGTTEVASETFRHWCAEASVTVAVKASAWDDASFEGIGFWTRDAALEVPTEKERVFYAKNDPRLVRSGDATLKDGARVYLYQFVGAGPCAVNGTGDNPGHELLFKPYVTYLGGHERWEELPGNGNHGLRFQQSWDRSQDLLR